MGDMGDMYRAMNEHRKERRVRNTTRSTQLLKDKGVEFEAKNGGCHLRISHGDETVDFWPSTGLFMVKNVEKGRGVHNLLKYINGL
jgi:hypothetical protein